MRTLFLRDYYIEALVGMNITLTVETKLNDILYKFNHDDHNTIWADSIKACNNFRAKGKKVLVPFKPFDGDVNALKTSDEYNEGDSSKRYKALYLSEGVLIIFEDEGGEMFTSSPEFICKAIAATLGSEKVLETNYWKALES